MSKTKSNIGYYGMMELPEHSRSMKKRVYVYEVKTSDLSQATGLMNSTDNIFISNVINVKMGEEYSLVTVEMFGSYPYVTNQWEQFVIGEVHN